MMIRIRMWNRRRVKGSILSRSRMISRVKKVENLRKKLKILRTSRMIA